LSSGDYARQESKPMVSSCLSRFRPMNTWGITGISTFYATHDACDTALIFDIQNAASRDGVYKKQELTIFTTCGSSLPQPPSTGPKCT
jgi:hypothetical protein